MASLRNKGGLAMCLLLALSLGSCGSANSEDDDEAVDTTLTASPQDGTNAMLDAAAAAGVQNGASALDSQSTEIAYIGSALGQTIELVRSPPNGNVADSSLTLSYSNPSEQMSCNSSLALRSRTTDGGVFFQNAVPGETACPAMLTVSLSDLGDGAIEAVWIDDEASAQVMQAVLRIAE